MNKFKISPEEVIFDGCDEGFAKAIEEFIVELNQVPSYSLLSKRYSIFSLMRKHLDYPFNELEQRCVAQDTHGVLTPSKLKYPRFLSKDQQSRYSGLTPHRKICFSLECWDEYIRCVIKKTSDQNDEYIAALDSLRVIVQSLPTWCLNARESINRDNLPSASKARTKKHIQPKSRYCVLCWRALNHVVENIDEHVYSSVNSIQTKYCFTHDRTRNIENGLRNYMRDRHYLKSFNREYASLTKTGVSRFHPEPSWYISQAREKGVAVGITEIRKIIYFLVRSGLDTSRRKEILSMNQKGQSIADIARQLGITRQAVHKTIKQIDSKMTEVINRVIH
jgi:DNA-binding NarL/FixJ family response regulator